MSKKIRWYKDRCKMCLNCVLFCPVKCLHVKDKKIVQEEEKCILCGMCERYCPDEAIQVIRNNKAKAKK